jgi:hypothetical protein
MSDPVKTEDIEDVLSSIRRLVSEEPKPSLPEPEAEAAQPEKLVLTPAFRVAEGTANSPSEPEPGEAEAVSGQPAADEDPEAGAWDMAADETEPEADLAGADEVSWQEIPFRHRVAEIEAAVAESGEEWEPDGTEIEHQDVALETIEATDSAGDSDDSDAGEGGEAVLDEESLRDLVVEIVRQELQGTMGQRITRNVRKLVRQEINRALASHDLD